MSPSTSKKFKLFLEKIIFSNTTESSHFIHQNTCAKWQIPNDIHKFTFMCTLFDAKVRTFRIVLQKKVRMGDFSFM